MHLPTDWTCLLISFIEHFINSYNNFSQGSQRSASLIFILVTVTMVAGIVHGYHKSRRRALL